MPIYGAEDGSTYLGLDDVSEAQRIIAIQWTTSMPAYLGLHGDGPPCVVMA